MLSAKDVSDIAITGGGVVDGQGLVRHLRVLKKIPSSCLLFSRTKHSWRAFGASALPQNRCGGNTGTSSGRKRCILRAALCAP